MSKKNKVVCLDTVVGDIHRFTINNNISDIEDGNMLRALTIGKFKTVFLNQKILCIIGYIEFLPREFEIVIIPSDTLKEHPIRIVKILRLLFDHYIRNLDYIRLQFLTIEKYRRWGEYLSKKYGFICEGKLRKYSSGNDAYMWSLV